MRLKEVLCVVTRIGIHCTAEGPVVAQKSGEWVGVGWRTEGYQIFCVVKHVLSFSANDCGGLGEEGAEGGENAAARAVEVADLGLEDECFVCGLLKEGLKTGWSRILPTVFANLFSQFCFQLHFLLYARMFWPLRVFREFLEGFPSSQRLSDVEVLAAPGIIVPVFDSTLKFDEMALQIQEVPSTEPVELTKYIGFAVWVARNPGRKAGISISKWRALFDSRGSIHPFYIPFGRIETGKDFDLDFSIMSLSAASATGELLRWG